MLLNVEMPPDNRMVRDVGQVFEDSTIDHWKGIVGDINEEDVEDEDTNDELSPEEEAVIGAFGRLRFESGFFAIYGEGTGVVVDADGELIIVTAYHVPSQAVGNGTCTFWLQGEEIACGTAAEFLHTSPHPYESSKEKGIAYRVIPEDSREIVDEMIAEGRLTPLVLDRWDEREIGDRVVLVRYDLKDGNRLQPAVVETVTNLDEGEFSYTVRDENGEYVACVGHSGSLVVLRDDEGVTNRGVGMVISASMIEGPDSYGSWDPLGSNCSSRFNLRPVSAFRPDESAGNVKVGDLIGEFDFKSRVYDVLGRMREMQEEGEDRVGEY